MKKTRSEKTLAPARESSRTQEQARTARARALKQRIAERDAAEQTLLLGLRKHRRRLEKLRKEVDDHWVYEDLVYRFYYQSFKVFRMQDVTTKIVAALQALVPGRRLNEWFVQIVKEGTGKTFEMEHNQRWLEVTRPIVEAFFHARYFLEMAVRYAVMFKKAPQMLPSGWAGLLCLYDLR